MKVENDLKDINDSSDQKTGRPKVRRLDDPRLTDQKLRTVIMDIDYKTPGSVSLFESGWGLYLLRSALFIVLAVFVLGGYAVVNFHGLKQREAMEIAQVARNMAQDHGYITHSISPFDIWYLQKQGQDSGLGAIPEMHHAPGYPVLLSWMYRIMRPDYKVSSDSGIFDAESKAVVPLGIILTVLSAVALFAAGLHIFGVRIAGIAVVIYLISNLTLSSMISGLPLPLLSLVVTMGCGFAIRAVYLSAIGGHNLKMLLFVLVSALCSAVAVLTDYTMIAVVAGCVVLFGFQLQRLRWVSILLFVVVVSLSVAPWLLHNQKLGVGVLGAKPYDALVESSLYQGNSLAGSVAPKFNSYRVSDSLRRKMFSEVSDDFSGHKAMAGGLVICFFVLAMFHRYENRSVAAFKGFVFGVLLLLVLVSPLIGPSYAVLGALFPLVTLLGVSAFIDYIEREEIFEQGMQNLLVWILVIVSALPAVARLINGSQPAYPPYYAPIQSFVCSMLDDDERLYTDIPWATAWYGDRTSVLLPQSICDIEKINGGWTNVGGVYLTSETSSDPVQQQADWRDVFYHKVPESIPFRQAIELPAGRRDQIFLTDRQRWE